MKSVDSEKRIKTVLGNSIPHFQTHREQVFRDRGHRHDPHQQYGTGKCAR